MWKRYLPRLQKRAKALKMRDTNLFFAMVFSLVGAVVVAIIAGWVLAPRLNMGMQRTSPADLTRLALTIAAGVGGVVALVVAYRRQRDLEQGRFVEAFGAAAKQLGDADVAVRLAGVYAMAGVADQTSKLKRQQCIDVLCGYLRLPYSPELGNNHQSALVLRKSSSKKGGPEQELQFQYRQNDKEVRQTIVRVIVTHLQEDAISSWSSNDFDFTRSHLELPDFRGAIFNGEALFTGVTFSAESTSFYGTTFSGWNTSFGGATFSSAITSFAEATFCGENTWFASATFNSKSTEFGGAIFRSAVTWFTGTTFKSASTSFSWATFSGANVFFGAATFSGANTSFDGAIFNGANTSFTGATFSGGRVTFEDPQAWDPPPEFDWDAGSARGTPKPANVEPQDWPPMLR